MKMEGELDKHLNKLPALKLEEHNNNQDQFVKLYRPFFLHRDVLHAHIFFSVLL